MSLPDLYAWLPTPTQLPNQGELLTILVGIWYISDEICRKYIFL